MFTFIVWCFAFKSKVSIPIQYCREFLHIRFCDFTPYLLKARLFDIIQEYIYEFGSNTHSPKTTSMKPKANVYPKIIREPEGHWTVILDAKISYFDTCIR